MTKYIGCQLAEEYKGWPEGQQSYLVEPKFDGYRLTAIVNDNGTVTYHCRDEGQPSWVENLLHFTDEILTVMESSGLTSLMLDGGVMAANWNETSKLLRRQRKNMDAAT